MLTKEIQYRYDEWLKNVSGDLLHELEKMDEKAIEDTFYKDLGLEQAVCEALWVRERIA